MITARRNARRKHADKLLADALDTVVSAIADVAAGDPTAQRRYAAAVSRIVLHGSPQLVDAFRTFQLDPTTGTIDGRHGFVAAVQAARHELGRPQVDDESAQVLFFGGTPPRN